MKFTQVAADAFKKLQLNAGIMLTEFDPESATLDKSKIFAATSGGNSFTAVPEYIDYGEDIDNVPANVKELKHQTTVEAKMSGTAKTIDSASGKAMIGAADWDPSTKKLTPRADLLGSDFIDIWWVGDYSDDNSDSTGGFIAIKLINALNTGGFSIQSNDDGKADFEYEFMGHYSLADLSKVPYEIYINEGSASASTTDASSLRSMTKSELVDTAHANGVDIGDDMTKADIIEAIENA